MPLDKSIYSPFTNATVSASAGTGKTWLLVSRIIRLLLEGVRPDAILAITFTRKAAAEMQIRLSQRLSQLLELDHQSLVKELENMGVVATDRMLKRARYLYELILRSDRRVTITTFHSFCQSILQKFPMEASVAPGFDIAENPGLLQSDALDALFSYATAHPDGELGQALAFLLDQFGDINGTQAVLEDFLKHRSDWWAFSAGKRDSIDHALQQLASQLDINLNQNPSAEFFCAATLDLLAKFLGLLRKHETKTNLGHAMLLEQALTKQLSSEQGFVSIAPVFLTKNNQAISRKPSKAQAKSMGEDDEARFLELHSLLCDRVLHAMDQLRRLTTLKTSRAWFIAGSHLLEQYQRLKNEQRLLDFNDLEWHTYLLLNHTDTTQWVQYKLEQRIDHLLIDEFQDTNPTQWQIIVPLLREFDAQGTERKRNIFLVGDIKQSIYGFRRADPYLLDNAHHWLTQFTHTKRYVMTSSWRSAPAVIDFINQVFGAGVLHQQLHQFETHQTHRTDLWGRIEILPLIDTPVNTELQTSDALRNPLLRPRSSPIDSRHLEEGRSIARCIKDIVDNNEYLLGSGDDARAPSYTDIIILVRKRTHAHYYQAALQEAGIPYIGASRGRLLEALEVRDMVALLNTLITPYDNLAIATVVRSPLFSCGDNDLMKLALARAQDSTEGTTWLDALATVSRDERPNAPLKYAYDCLSRWHSLAGKIPVHDLLDRIYCEADVVTRYQTAFPKPLRARVQANLNRLLELALETDSGRYPSLPYFLSHLSALQEHGQDAPDEAPAIDDGNGVRIMTIHACKGLEAPIVFVADACNTASVKRPHSTMVYWPTDSKRPSHFFVTGKRSNLDSFSLKLLEQRAQEEYREQANLLYVALTRAKQMLFISGCAPRRGQDLGWYGMLVQQVKNAGKDPYGGWILETGPKPQAKVEIQPSPQQEAANVDPRLTKPIFPQHSGNIRTTATEENANLLHYQHDDDGQTRGIAIHKILQLLSSAKQTSDYDSVMGAIAGELALDPTDPSIRAWWQEAYHIYNDKRFRPFFDPRAYDSAYNEVPIQYYASKRLVFGIIDRLIVLNNELILVDYKTHKSASIENIAQLSQQYREQMQRYYEGLSRLWPDYNIRAVLLYTACGLVHEMET